MTRFVVVDDAVRGYPVIHVSTEPLEEALCGVKVVCEASARNVINAFEGARLCGTCSEQAR